MQERLGLLLDKEDEMDCLVGGANFLLKAIRHEAFMYENGQTVFALSNCEPPPPLPPPSYTYTSSLVSELQALVRGPLSAWSQALQGCVPCDDSTNVQAGRPELVLPVNVSNGHKTFCGVGHTEAEHILVRAADADLYPYLLVNIGSGVSMLKVAGDGQYERVSGSSLGGGTFWGLCRLLTKCRGFDEMLELSMRGNNANVTPLACAQPLMLLMINSVILHVLCCLNSLQGVLL